MKIIIYYFENTRNIVYFDPNPVSSSAENENNEACTSFQDAWLDAIKKLQSLFSLTAEEDTALG